ncbi:sugar ABC transporter substrate-binding protein [Pannus brasiliensis CCIBt3594]|uniref:Sugar ABC transporter substrate-binding protein n=1 Tax=Pannus brasiliensis CCIBt3594 TaxID=1427578 RepID=A0AAW9QXN6_9CHRO
MFVNSRRPIVIALLVLLLVGCRARVREPGTLNVWVHSGQSAEREVIEKQVERFNARNRDIAVQLTLLPEGSYNAQVQAAAIAGELPDLLEFDGPFVYSYVWQKNLIPLDKLLPARVRKDLLPSIDEGGTYKGRLYSVGTFDSGLGLYGRRGLLQAAGARIPTANGEAWTAGEFDRLLEALARNDPDGQVLDLKLNYQGEWFTYAFSPILQSAGGDLIDRRHYRSARGVLNGRASIAAMERLQSWIQKGYVDPDIDDAAFVGGRVALSWSGHWVYRDYADAFGDDLVVLPLPNFGRGSKTGQGSWTWGITANCSNPKAAARFLEFLLQPDEVLALASANGAVPGTKRAIVRSPLYAKDGPLRLFASQLLDRRGVPRPRTPAYPVITDAFGRAFDDIRHALPVEIALNKAVETIDLDIQDNQGYRDSSPTSP